MQEKIAQKKPDKMTPKQLDLRPFANLEELVLLDTGSTCSSIMNENMVYDVCKSQHLINMQTNVGAKNMTMMDPCLVGKANHMLTEIS